MVKHGDGSWLGHFDHQSPHTWTVQNLLGLPLRRKAEER